MTFLRTTTGKLLVLAGIWVVMTRVGLLFVDSTTPPAPDPGMATPITVAAGADRVMPVVARVAEKSQATLRIRLAGPTSTDLGLLVFDEAAYAGWRNERGAMPLYSSNVRVPCDLTIRLGSPGTHPIPIYYVLFSNRGGSAPKTLMATAWVEDAQGPRRAVIARLTFVGLIAVSISVALFAGLRSKTPRPAGEFYAVPPGPAGG